MDPFSDIFDQLDRELWLVTARYQERQSGLVATYLSKVSLVPSLPRVTIALAKHHLTHDLIEEAGAFCLHLFDESHLDWVWRFGIPSGREVDKFDGLTTSTTAGGAPILEEAPAWFDCRVEAGLDTGDRTIFLAEVLDAQSKTLAEDREPGMQPWKALTFKRLMELAPPERLQELRQAMDRDVELDRAAILAWRRKRQRHRASESV